MTTELIHLPNGEVLYDEATELAIRGFCIQALAMSVPEFLNRDRAVEMVEAWFPGDRLAIAGLYKAINNQPAPRAA